MKKIIIILVFCLLGLSLTAQEKVAIIPFTGGSGDEGNAIAQILKAEFTELGNFQIAPHTQAMDTVLEDKNIQKIGLTHGDTIARLGKSANADYVVSGHIQTLDSRKIVLTSIIHVKTFQQIAGDYYEYYKFAEVIDYLPTLAEKLVSKTKTDYLSLPTLAILPFHGAVKEKATGLKGFFAGQSSSKANETNTELLLQLLAIEIANSEKYGVISREETITNIMEEQNIKVNDLADVDTATKLGKEINTQYVLSGTVSPIGDDDLMNVAIIEISSLTQKAGAYVKYKTVEKGIKFMPELSSQLTGVLSDKTALNLSVEDAIALYEDDETERHGIRIIEILKDLVSEGINARYDKNKFDHYYRDYTPLIYASRHGYTEIVKSLIASGADINAKTDNNETALFAAAEYAHIAIVKTLIDAGANIDTRGISGYTALMVAARDGDTEVVTVFVEAGVDFDIKNNEGRTALYLAALNSQVEVMKVLKKAGAKNLGDRRLSNSLVVRLLKISSIIWIVFGAVVFGFYFLLYKLTKKIKGNVKSTSFIVKIPLLNGWGNLLCVTLFLILEHFFILHQESILFVLYLYCFSLITPISIGSIAISLVEYKKKLITGKRLKTILLINIINILLCLWCLLFIDTV